MQRFWRIALVVVAVVAAFGATGLGVAYTLGVFTDAGRFRSAPDCAVLDASAVAAVVPAAKIEADGDNCTAGDGKTQLNVGFTVVSKKGTVGGPELASAISTWSVAPTMNVSTSATRRSVSGCRRSASPRSSRCGSAT